MTLSFLSFASFLASLFHVSVLHTYSSYYKNKQFDIPVQLSPENQSTQEQLYPDSKTSHLPWFLHGEDVHGVTTNEEKNECLNNSRLFWGLHGRK